MIDPDLTPTRLVDPSDRPPVVFQEPLRPSRFHGFRVIVRAVGLALTIAGLAVRRRLTERELGVRLRAAFEDLGGLWVKAGHLLSLRIDVLPPDVSEELAKLQSRHFGFPTHHARRIIEEELGGPLERYFDEFSDVPFAVASIAQVHRARLRQEQRYVAVKVQQPYVQALFERDLVHIRRAVAVIRLFRIRLHLRWDFAMDEISELMAQELNFYYEASSIRRMRRRLRTQKVYVPELFGRYSTRRVLVTEFVHATLMADVIKLQREDPARLDAWLTENNIVPRIVARRLTNSMLRQTLEHNLYHGNPNPWNIVLLRDSCVAFIDFTSTTFTEREYLEKYRLFVRALAAREYAKAADMCFMLCATLPNFDLEEVKEQLVRSLRAWATRTLVKELPYRQKSLDEATIELIRVLVKYRCTMEWGWLRIRRSILMLDLSVEHLYPEANYTRLLQKYFAKAEIRALNALIGPPLIRRTLSGYLTTLEIQDRVNEYTMFQGALVRRHAQVFKGATNKAAAIFATIISEVFLVVLLCFVGAALLFLAQRYPARIEPPSGRNSRRGQPWHRGSTAQSGWYSSQCSDTCSARYVPSVGASGRRMSDRTSAWQRYDGSLRVRAAAASRWTDSDLDRFRHIADPEADAIAEQVCAVAGLPGLARLTEALGKTGRRRFPTMRRRPAGAVRPVRSIPVVDRSRQDRPRGGFVRVVWPGDDEHHPLERVPQVPDQCRRCPRLLHGANLQPGFSTEPDAGAGAVRSLHDRARWAVPDVALSGAGRRERLALARRPQGSGPHCVPEAADHPRQHPHPAETCGRQKGRDLGPSRFRRAHQSGGSGRSRPVFCPLHDGRPEEGRDRTDARRPKCHVRGLEGRCSPPWLT